MKHELATIQQELAQAPSPALILQAAVQGGVTKENVEVVEKLAALMERQQDREAEQAFNRALNALQAEMPKVQAKKAVPNKDGSLRYVYAPYEEIRRQADPFIRTHGFSVTFDSTTSEDGKRVTVTCKVRHRDGHCEPTSYTGRIGNGPPGSNETQADGAGFTYAKRMAFCSALGIVVETDTDGADGGGDDYRDAGKPISASDAADLQAKVEELGSKFNVAAFKDWLGVKTYSEVPESRLTEAYAQIAKWEAKNAGK